MVRDEAGMGWLGRIIALVVVTALFWGAYFAWLAPKLPAVAAPAFAEDGDLVDVDYRGWFPDTGRTFDTSLESVATDNASFPKAASFSFRAGAARYTPLQWALGCSSGPQCPLTAFQDAVRGLHVRDSRIIVLPPEKAYGPSDPTKIHVRPLVEDVVATETMTSAEFQARFGLQPVDASIVTDPTWNWNATVRVAGDLVTIRASPNLYDVVRVSGRWDAEVLSIDDAANGGLGAIRVDHRLTPADVRAFVAADAKGNFIVVALDEAEGTYTVDYNNEVIGKTLAFEITLVALRKAP
ncbi:MAG TPA: FKBP-type peptidyl-prolyl cis-trans isomerase [Thermoplasmata archaeon]|nr:FKBP-type peptidyl-prolyl cis-trans isomerase [Thermoplasmata archaeon]